MAVQYNSKIVTDGLILCLDAANRKSYPGSGTTWTDLSGRGNNGNLNNGVGYTIANGGSLSFDSTDDFATVPSSSLFSFGTGNFTLDVWIFVQSFPTYTHMIALPNQNTFALKANVGDGQIYYYDPSFTTYDVITQWKLVSNSWNNVVFKRESSVAEGFLNSISRGTKSGFNTNFTSQTLNIHNGWPGEFNQCNISNVRIYNRALSAAEIQQNFNATRGRYGI